MIKQLTDKTFYMSHSVETDRPALGLVCGSRASLIIDSGNCPEHGKAFLEGAREIAGSPIKYLAITHTHWDHVFGIDAMGLTTIANNIAKENLDAMRALKWDDESMEERGLKGLASLEEANDIRKAMPTREHLRIGHPDVLFSDRVEVDLGGVTCILDRIGGSHTEDSTLVYVPEEKVLFMGDCIYGRRYSGVYGYKRETLFPMIDRLKEFDADCFLVSHMEPKSRADMHGQLNQLQAFGELVGDEEDMEAVLQRFKALYKREANESEAFYLNSFAGVARL